MGTRRSPGTASSAQEHMLSVAQGVLVGLGGAMDLWEPAPPPTPFHLPCPGVRRASQCPPQEAALSPDLQAALPRSPPGEHLTGLEMGLRVSRPPCLSICKGNTFLRGAP